MVWVNTESHVYHKEGSRFYGKTKQGKYVSEADAIKEGDRASKTNDELVVAFVRGRALLKRARLDLFAETSFP